jgi:hypothetical protein
MAVKLTMELEKITDKVTAETGKSKEEFLGMVEKKKRELEGLVSDIGAAHIVANEMGVPTLPKPKEPKIKELKVGNLGSITFDVRTAYPARDFTTKTGRSGSVANMIVEDETGSTRLVLWGSHSKLTNEVGRGAKLRVVNCYVKEGMNGLEVHVSSRTRINVLEKGQTLDAVGLDKIENGKFVRARATVRKILAERSFWRCKERDCKFRGEECPDHGKCEEVPVVTAILDDGLREVRGVFFGDRAQLATRGNEKYFVGKAKLNDFRGDLEISVFRSEDVDIRQEIENLLK